MITNKQTLNTVNLDITACYADIERELIVKFQMCQEEYDNLQTHWQSREHSLVSEKCLVQLFFIICEYSTIVESSLSYAGSIDVTIVKSASPRTLSKQPDTTCIKWPFTLNG